MHLKKLVVLALLIFFNKSQAQKASDKYPQNYFSWPAKASKDIVANFGELRPNHYHMGLDVRTDRKENVPILAAAAGYVSKVKVEPWGFGRAIYIAHPNGLTTVYAHLNAFYPELEAYVKAEQYKQKSWAVFIEIPKDQFPVAQNQFIANSGNTGGSMGPHLHFEIRDTKSDKVLNPLLFGFPLTDNVAPKVARLAVYDRCKSTYEQVPRFVALKKVGNNYDAGTIVVNTDKVSFGIGATDAMSATPNANGIYSAELFSDGQKIVRFELDSIDYDDTRYLNANIDHKLKLNGGPYVQHVSKLPGHPEGIYTTFFGDGVINLEDDSTHQIKILVTDAYDNKTFVTFSIKRQMGFAKAPADTSWFPGQKFYFKPGFVNIFEKEYAKLHLIETAVYDSFQFTYKMGSSALGRTVHTLHTAAVPVHNYFPVSLKDNFTNPSKIMIHRFWNGKEEFKKPSYADGWYTAKFKTLGNFELIEDYIPPSVVPVGIKDGANLSKATSIKFVIVDNTEELEFTALLDGQWLCFSADKGKNFVYKFDEKCPPGLHTLEVTANDLAGNKTVKTFTFTR